MQSPSKPLVIINTGSNRPTDPALLKPEKGDVEQWITQAIDHSQLNLEVLQAKPSPNYPRPEECAGVIVTGSPAYATANEAWSEKLGNWISELLEANTPLLGICFGHQLIARVAGGFVGFNPQGINIGCTDIREEEGSRNDPLFSEMPSTFQSFVMHVQSVLRVPEGAVVLATDEKGMIQAIRFGEKAWGLQFHPELNPELMEAFIDWKDGAIKNAGQNRDDLKSRLVECEHSRSLLARFVAIAMQGAADEAVTLHNAAESLAIPLTNCLRPSD